MVWEFYANCIWLSLGTMEYRTTHCAQLCRPFQVVTLCRNDLVNYFHSMSKYYLSPNQGAGQLIKREVSTATQKSGANKTSIQQFQSSGGIYSCQYLPPSLTCNNDPFSVHTMADPSALPDITNRSASAYVIHSTQPLCPNSTLLCFWSGRLHTFTAVSCAALYTSYRMGL